MTVESISIGNGHSPNEDRLIVQDMGTYGLCAILADGLGGLNLGDIAADIITKSIAEFLKKNYQGNAEKDVLLRAMCYADEKVREESIKNKCKMGAAVAVAIIFDHRLYCTWQGNIRVYILSNGKTSLITQDHVANIGYGRTALTRCIKGAGLREDVPSSPMT